MNELEVNIWSFSLKQYTYFEKADPTASVGTSEVFVIIKVYITQEPCVGKLLTGAVKPLIATQMPSWGKYVYSNLYKDSRHKFILLGFSFCKYSRISQEASFHL